MGALKPHKIPKYAPQGGPGHLRGDREREQPLEFNLYISGTDEDNAENDGRAATHGTARRQAESATSGRRMKVAYWPGCVSRGFTPELHGSMAAVAPLLDIELVELDRACCSGAGVIAEHNQELADTLNARTFALAQQVEGADLMMNICSTCQGAQGECQERLDASAEYRGHVNPTLAEVQPRVPRGLANKNFLWVLVEEFGLDDLRERVNRPLTDLTVGPFYGCYIVRPTERLGIDDEHPRDTYLAQVIEALGGTVIEYAGSHKCCGFPIITMNKDASLKQAGRHLGDAADADADCLVTPCPLCHLNLDLQQPLAERTVGPRAEHAGAAPAPARRPGPRPEPEGARPGAPRRQADVGHRLDDVRRGGRGRHLRRRGGRRTRLVRLPKLLRPGAAAPSPRGGGARPAPTVHGRSSRSRRRRSRRASTPRASACSGPSRPSPTTRARESRTPVHRVTPVPAGTRSPTMGACSAHSPSHCCT